MKVIHFLYLFLSNLNSNLNGQNNPGLLSPYNAVVFSPSSGLPYLHGSSYRKIGTRVILYLTIRDASKTTSNIITVLPIGYRPVMPLSCIISDGTDVGTASVNINVGGTITAFTHSGYIMGEIEFEAYS